MPASVRPSLAHATRPLQPASRPNAPASPDVLQNHAGCTGGGALTLHAPRAPEEPTAADLAFLWRLVGRRWDHAVQRVLPDGTLDEWDQETRHGRPGLTDHDLKAHLAGSLALGTYAGTEGPSGRPVSVTQHVLIDLDRRFVGPAGTVDLQQRVRDVRAALGTPTAILRTPSGGVHLLYWLGAPVSLFDLRVPRGRYGAIPRLLAHAEHVLMAAPDRNRPPKLHEQPGVLEVFPTARMSSVWERVCRVPCGPSSVVVDPQTLEPCRDLTGLAALRWLSAGIGSGALPTADAAAWIRTANAVRLPRPTRERRRAERRARTLLQSAEERFAPYAAGLPAFGTRNTAVAAYAYLLLARGEPLDVAKRRVWRWLEQNHGGNSKDYRDAIGSAARMRALRNDTEATVARIHARLERFRPGAARAPLPLVTDAEARWALAYALAAATTPEIFRASLQGNRPARRRPTARAGKAVAAPARCTRADPLRLLAFSLFLIRLARQQVVARTRAALEVGVPGRHPFDAHMRRLCPDLARARFVIALPSAARRKAGGGLAGRAGARAVGQDAEASYFRVLQQALPSTEPIFTRRSGHFAQGGKCADFWTRLDIDGAGEYADAFDVLLRVATTDERDRVLAASRGAEANARGLAAAPAQQPSPEMLHEMRRLGQLVASARRANGRPTDAIVGESDTAVASVAVQIRPHASATRSVSKAGSERAAMRRGAAPRPAAASRTTRPSSRSSPATGKGGGGVELHVSAATDELLLGVARRYWAGLSEATVRVDIERVLDHLRRRDRLPKDASVPDRAALARTVCERLDGMLRAACPSATVEVREASLHGPTLPRLRWSSDGSLTTGDDALRARVAMQVGIAAYAADVVVGVLGGARDDARDELPPSSDTPRLAVGEGDRLAA